MTSILIKNALIVTSRAHAAPFFGWLSIKDTLIDKVAAGTAPEDKSFDRVIDAKGAPLMPGLINTHAHSHSTITRGTAEGLELDEWLQRIYKEMAGLSEEFAYRGALATYGESLLSGTTSIMDMCVNPEAAARAAEKLGIRLKLAPYCGDRLPFAPTLARNEELVKRFNTKDSRITVLIGMHESETCSDEQFKAAVKLAERLDVGLHTHCAETTASEDATRKRTGRGQLAHLDSFGFLGPRTVLAHCVWLSEPDQELALKRGIHIAHCPQSNLKIGSGIAPIPKYRAGGLNVSLATDGAKANNCLDQFDTMKFASLLPKGLQLNPAVLHPSEVIEMATENGGKALGLKTGKLEPGYKADLVLLRNDRIRLQPIVPETILTNIVHSARGPDVDTVLVDGVVVVEGSRLVAMDEAEISALTREAADALMA